MVPLQNPTVYGIRLGSQDKVLAGNVSADYLLVNNKDLVDICVNEVLNPSGISFEHHKRFFNNKGQFRDIYYADNAVEASVPEVGDVLRLVAEIQNSTMVALEQGLDLTLKDTSSRMV